MPSLSFLNNLGNDPLMDVALNYNDPWYIMSVTQLLYDDFRIPNEVVFKGVLIELIFKESDFTESECVRP